MCAQGKAQAWEQVDDISCVGLGALPRMGGSHLTFLTDVSPSHLSVPVWPTYVSPGGVRGPWVAAEVMGMLRILFIQFWPQVPLHEFASWGLILVCGQTHFWVTI